MLGNCSRIRQALAPVFEGGKSEHRPIHLGKVAGNARRPQGQRCEQ